MIKTNETLCLAIQNGESRLLDELCELNRGYVIDTAARLKKMNPHLPLDMDDLIQNGMLGLIEASCRFDPSRGTLFLTYATKWIRKRMLEEIDAVNREATHLDITLLEEESVFMPLMDSYAPYLLSPEAYYIKKEWLEDLYRRIKMNLSPRERCYIRYRFGFEDGEAHSAKESAEHFHLRRIRAERIEDIALKHLWQRRKDNVPAGTHMEKAS